MELRNKVAIVTGSGRGIGKSIAMNLANEGCKVVLTSRTKNQLREVENEIKKRGREAISVEADLSNTKNINHLIDCTLDNFNTLDILINNAGIHFDTPLLEVTEKEWDTAMNINLKAVFLLSQKALKIMKEKKSGYIINISSTAALQVPARAAAYGTSKLGVVGFSQALYETAKEYGVKVSIIYPGMTDTQMLREINLPVDPNCWMLPKDISDCILFLLKQSDRVVIKEMVPWAARHDKI